MPVVNAITADAEWYVGEDKVLDFAIIDAAGVAVSIAGWAISWALRVGRYNTAPPVITKSTVSGITINADQVGTGKGKFTVQIDRTDTDDLKAGTYFHAAVRTDTGNWDVLSEGIAVLKKAALA